MTGYFNAQVSGFRCLSPAPPHPFWPVILTPGYPVSSSSLPLRRILFWPAILTPGYPVSGASLPLRLTLFDRLFWRPAIRFLVPLSRSAASYSDRLFWRPAIRFPVPLSRSAASPSDRLFYRPAIRFSVPHLPLRLVFFWPAILTPRSPFSGTPGPSFRSPFWYPWSSFSAPSFFPPNLPFPVIWVAGSLFVPPYGQPAVFYRSAVFTAPRFLPPRGFYRSTVFTAPLSPIFFGGSALPPPSCLLPPSLPPLPAGSLLVPPCGSTAIFTAPRFFPLRGFYRSAVFTAPRFLPLRGFYRAAFTGSLGGFALPPPSCLLPPSLHPLPGGYLFGPPCGTPAIFTAPRFLPLRGFYRSAVFIAPRFLPLRGFYRAAIFTAPLSPVLWGLCSSLLPPSLRPLPGAPCATGSSVASPVGRHSWSSFCTTCLTALGALPLVSPVSLLCISYTLGDHRSSRLLNDGTRAPRVLPPPSWDLSAIGN